MTKTRQNMEMTFKIHGRDITLSRDELIKILEKHFSTAPLKKVVRRPIEGKCFEVNPDTIDQSLFSITRTDLLQEKTRKIILQAFDMVKINPGRYGKKFYTLVPRTGPMLDEIRIGELIELYSELGDHNADWVEQALEWAQRICNGESWERLCNRQDKLDNSRLIEWNVESKEFLAVGGFDVPSSYVYNGTLHYDDCTFLGVPLLVRYNTCKNL